VKSKAEKGKQPVRKVVAAEKGSTNVAMLKGFRDNWLGV
jgi:hypothetical protein